MTEPLNRDEIISLLERLGGADDAGVLDAARALHAAVAGAGTTWDDLLAPEDGGGDVAEAEDTGADDVADAGPGDVVEALDEAEIPAGNAKRDAAALALIDKLLARSGVTDSFREEMDAYRHDIAEGDFTDADHKYLRALAKRLSGKG